jgi:predicted nucleic acid-binding protein
VGSGLRLQARALPGLSLFVDTSVWSLALRRDRPPDVPEVAALERALTEGELVTTTGLVYQELLQGFLGPRDQQAILTRFGALPFLSPDRHDHFEAAQLRNRARGPGRHDRRHPRPALHPLRAAAPHDGRRLCADRRARAAGALDGLLLPCEGAGYAAEVARSLAEASEVIEADLLRESRKHKIVRILETAPGIGPIRAARLVPVVVTPHRFRTKRQFWSYCGLGLVTRSSPDWVQTAVGGWIRPRVPQTRGLSRQHNRVLREIFKGAATLVIAQRNKGPLYPRYERMLAGGTKPSLAKLTLARIIAATVLRMWKDEEEYRPERRAGTLWIQTAARRRPSGWEAARRAGRREAGAHNGFGGEHPCFSWSRDAVLETRRVSYAPPQNRKKRWPEQAPMEDGSHDSVKNSAATRTPSTRPDSILHSRTESPVTLASSPRCEHERTRSTPSNCQVPSGTTLRRRLYDLRRLYAGESR